MVIYMGNIIENRNYCVYVHTSPNGKMYIGQTGLKPEKRWGKNGSYYLKKKKNGEYVQRVFAHAILKYGWDNFEHEIIASNLTKEEADNFEKLLIEKLNTMDSQYGYNLREGGSRGSLSEEARKKLSELNKGKKHSEEAKVKMSESRKGRPLSDKAREALEESRKRYKIVQYSLEGEFIKIWDSISDAGRELEIDISSIAKCCKGFYRNAGGFIWKYFEDELTKEELILRNTTAKERCVAQYSLSGELICIFSSIKEASLKTNVYRNNISRCCSGTRKTAGGFIWKHYENIEEVA